MDVPSSSRLSFAILTPMTYARRHLLDLRDPGWVHCVSRCVRRAFLMEGDSASSSRKVWVERRLGVVTAGESGHTFHSPNTATP